METIIRDPCKGLGHRSSINVNCYYHRWSFFAFAAGLKKMALWLVWKINREELKFAKGLERFRGGKGIRIFIKMKTGCHPMCSGPRLKTLSSTLWQSPRIASMHLTLCPAEDK